MDVFPDRESAALFAGQTHDYNPGITESGLFWTLLIAPESARSTSRSAEMCLRDLFMPDFGTFENALLGGKIDPAMIDIDCRWESTSHSSQVDRNEDLRYVYRFRPADAVVEWKANGPTGTFRSVDSGTPQETLFGAVGFERNGRFFG